MKQYSLFIILFCLLSAVHAQTSKQLVPGYYTIVGVYSNLREAYAQKYAESLKSKGIQADYGFNPGRNQYLVYVGYFQDLKSCLNDMRSKRKGGAFPDAWVRVVTGIVGSSAPQLATQESEKFHETTKAETQDTTNGYTDLEYWQPPIKQYEKMMLGNTEVFLSMFDKA